MTYERPFATEGELWDVGRMAELVSALPHLTLGLEQAEVIIGSAPGGITEKTVSHG